MRGREARGLLDNVVLRVAENDAAPAAEVCGPLRQRQSLLQEPLVDHDVATVGGDGLPRETPHQRAGAHCLAPLG